LKNNVGGGGDVADKLMLVLPQEVRKREIYVAIGAMGV
jgi:hypothetical protein